MHKPTSTENDVKSENDWEEDEIFFTDRQYRQDGSICGRYKSEAYTTQGGPYTNPPFSSQLFQRTKKCFVCGKISYWSTKHTQQERDDSKKKFGDRYP